MAWPKLGSPTRVPAALEPGRSALEALPPEAPWQQASADGHQRMCLSVPGRPKASARLALAGTFLALALIGWRGSDDAGIGKGRGIRAEVQQAQPGDLRDGVIVANTLSSEDQILAAIRGQREPVDQPPRELLPDTAVGKPWLPAQPGAEARLLPLLPSWDGRAGSMSDSRRNQGLKSLQVHASPSACSRYSSLTFADEGTPAHSNLGNQGPDSSPEGMIYNVRNAKDGKMFELHINALSQYTPHLPSENKFHGKFGNINLSPGSHVDLKISFFDQVSKQPAVMHSVAFTFFDLTKLDGTSQSFLVDGADFSILEPGTVVVKRDFHNGTTLFHSSDEGDDIAEGRPVDPKSLTETQKRRSVSLAFTDVHQIRVTLSAGAGKAPRWFLFLAQPTLLCAQTSDYKALATTSSSQDKLPTLQFKSVSGEQPVLAGGKGSQFVHWMVKEGDVLRQGDPVCLVRESTGRMDLISMPAQGVVRQLQDLRGGDFLDERLGSVDSHRIIAVMSPLKKLPALDVSKYDVPIMTGRGATFQRWIVQKGAHVEKGDPIASVLFGRHSTEQLVLAPGIGTVSALQPLHKGDEIDKRLPDQSIALVTNIGAKHCAKYSYLRFLKLVHNNLGDKGPDRGEEGMVFEAHDEQSGRDITVHINALTPYTPFSPTLNGWSGPYGSINLRPGTYVDLRITLRDPKTDTAIPLEELAFTFFDIDQHVNGSCQEYVTVGGYSLAVLEPTTEVVSVQESDGRTRYHSSTQGDGSDNPKNPSNLTQQQKDRAVTLFYKDVQELNITLGAGAGTIPRFFMFVGRPSLLCASTFGAKPDFAVSESAPRLPALVIHDGEAGVHGSDAKASFQRWYLGVGDPVNAGDAVALTKTASGRMDLISAAHDGTLVRTQGLHHGDVVGSRVPDGVVGVIKVGEMRPLLKCSEDETPIRSVPGSRFVEWTVEEGDSVSEGDTLAYTYIPGKRSRKHAVKAPTNGMVKYLQELYKWNSIDDHVRDRVIVVLGRPAHFIGLTAGPGELEVLVHRALHGSRFQSWDKITGQAVHRGDVLARYRDKNSNEVQVLSPGDGYLKAHVPLRKDDMLEERLQDPATAIAVVATRTQAPPLPIEGNQVGVKSTQGQIFGEWRVHLGGKLKKGDVVAVVRSQRDIIDITAPMDGTLVQRARLTDGMDIERWSQPPLFVIEPPMKLPQLAVDLRTEVAVQSLPGTVFREWKASQGQHVLTGDVIARVMHEGEERVIHATRAGIVTKLQSLEAGDSIDQHTDQPIAVIKLEPRLPALEVQPGQVAIESPHGATLLAWKLEEGDLVHRGDTVALLVSDGLKWAMMAPSAGALAARAAVKPGETIDHRIMAQPLAVIEAAARFKPLSVESPAVPVTSRPGDIFNVWKVGVGDRVRKQDTVALVTDKRGMRFALKANATGRVMKRQPLAFGQRIEFRIESGPIALLKPEPPLKLAAPREGEVLVRAPARSLFKAWRAVVDDFLRVGDTICWVVRADGSTRPVEADRAGYLTARQDELAEGDDLDDLVQGREVALVGDFMRRFDEKPTRILVKAPSGTTFKSWRRKPGDKVQKGEPLALLENADSRAEEAVQAPVSGTIAQALRLKAGDSLADCVEPPLAIAVLDADPLPPLMRANDRVQPVAVSEEDLFVRWLVDEGAEVKQGERLAIVRRKIEASDEDDSRIETEIFSPIKGFIAARLELQEDAPVGKMTQDNVLCLVDPRQRAPEAVRRGGVAVTLGPFQLAGNFRGWSINMGDVLEAGAFVAVVDPADVPHTDDGRRLASVQQVVTPVEGLVVWQADLLPDGTPLSDVLAGSAICILAPRPAVFPAACWVFLFFFLCGSFGIGVALLWVGRPVAERYYTAISEEAQALKDASMNVLEAESTEGSTETRTLMPLSMPETEYSEKGVRMDFLDPGGELRTKILEYRPLGVNFAAEAPIRIASFGFNSYAKSLNVEVGWTIVAIGDQSLESERNLSKVKTLIMNELGQKPVWPLTLEFKVPIAGTVAGTVTPATHFSENREAFHCTTRPVGIEFVRKAPVVVSKVHPKSWAKQAGIQEKWKIVRIADADVERASYDEVMKLFRDGVDTLDPKDSGGGAFLGVRSLSWLGR